jgi:7-cyano-7-deazaguanine synthase
VPNRNGVLVNIAAAFAERLEADTVVVGFNREEAATFPDNGVEFVEAATRALALSTRKGVRVACPVGGLRKDEIVRLGREIGAPLREVWPCYEGGERMCGTCESCRRFRRALARAGLEAWFDGRLPDGGDAA